MRLNTPGESKSLSPVELHYRHRAKWKYLAALLAPMHHNAALLEKHLRPIAVQQE
jgi:hypothetical protein